mmetsp:Transcript_94787/g.182144  ORF Transcript_94787/g.182144 Transcript_94787/m.182144 type:complete len:350 (-) Transcript_94787:113-1162(-)
MVQEEPSAFEVDEPPRPKPLLATPLPDSASGMQTQIAPQPPLVEIHNLAAQWAHVGRTPRIHEIMPRLGSRMRFRCGGRCITGPSHVDLKFNVCAWTSILAPTIFYYMACAPALWSMSPWIPTLTALLFAITIAFLLITSCTDPGVIPRHSLRLVVDGLAEEVAIAIGCGGLPMDLTSMEPDRRIMQELGDRGYRWCSFCRMVQPPRAKHCRDCDSCILRNDHHCPFVNNCIGQRNYIYFCAFLISVVCLGVAVFLGIGLWLWSAEGDESPISTTFETVLVSVLTIPTAVFLVGVLGLSVFHAVLICRGRTTREVLTGRRYGEGATLFGLRGKSLVDGRRLVTLPSLDV